MKSKMRVVLVLLMLSVLLVSAAQAQDSFVVGIVNATSAYDTVIDSMKATLTALGYVEGENVTYVYEGVAGEEVAAFAQRVIDADPDVLVTLTTRVTEVVLGLTDDIPVVFAPVVDPIGAGFVESLEHPGGMATGVTNGGYSVPRLEYFLQLVPGVERLYVPFDPNDAASNRAMSEITPVLAERQIELLQQEVTDEASTTAAIAALPEDIDAIYVAPGGLLTATTDDWLAAAMERGIPLTAVRLAAQGVLLTYSDDLGVTGEQTAEIVAQVLEGTPPGEIPVATSQFILTINEHTAQLLGIDIRFGGSEQG